MSKPVKNDDSKGDLNTFLRKHTTPAPAFERPDRVAVLIAFFGLIGFAVYWSGHALPLWALLLTGKVASVTDG